MSEVYETEETRASQVEALKTEREYLARQPHPNKARIKQVDEQLDSFSDKPSRPRRQKAVKSATAKKAAAVPAAAPPAAPPAGDGAGDPPSGD